jgi:hypothetical protein
MKADEPLASVGVAIPKMCDSLMAIRKSIKPPTDSASVGTGSPALVNPGVQGAFIEGTMCTQEKKLWSAVLELAYDDAIGKVYSRHLASRRVLIESARAWFNSKTRRDPGSFLWVCDTLDFDPKRWRAKVNDVIPEYY